MTRAGAARPGARRADTAVCVLAAVVAFGTLAWMEALHALLLASTPPGAAHLLRDGLLALPPALAAALWGLRSPRRLTAAAARVAAAFGALLMPAAVAHEAVHRADAGAVAHAAGDATGAAAATGARSDGLADAVLHAATDALLALPVAFLISLGALALLLGGRDQRLHPAPRRRLLALGASTLVVAGAAAVVPVSGAASPEYPKFAVPLAIPPVLTGQDIQIDIAQTQQQILPGPTTTMWTYDGSFPGPIIRRPSGVPTRVTFTNDLPSSAGSLSVHHHGTQSPEPDDGHPSLHLIQPGASRTYTYPGLDEGAPERAAPQWYHDHRDMVTGRNVWMGLMGAFIYDDPLERSLDLPQGAYDVPLMVTDREFDADNQIPYTFNLSGTFGDVILVNGRPQPFHEVGDRRYRFRLYNVSNRRDYVFRLGNGQAMTQIGTDSGLLPAPVSRTSIRLGPAERADVVIDFAGRLGEEIVLENAAAALGPGDRDGEVMQFRVTQDLTDDSAEVPATLRPVFETDPPVVTRVWNLDRSGGEWTINGKGFDPARVDAHPVLGTTERWIFRNPTTLPHIAHVHLADQKLVSRNGRRPTADERVKDSWYLAAGDEVVVDVRFSDHVGRFIFHCHVLEHEDHSMMTQFETLPPAPPAPVPPPPAPLAPGPALPGALESPAPSARDAPQRRPQLSRRVRVLSSTRLSHVLRRGIRFQTAVAGKRSPMRAELRVGGRLVGLARRSPHARGPVRVTLKLSRHGRERLRRIFDGRRRVAAQLTIRTAGQTRIARFAVRR